MEQKNIVVDNNARAFKRILSFFIDYFFINVLLAFTVQLFVFTDNNITKINTSIAEFKTLFGSIALTDIKDYHIRFIVNSPIFSSFMYSLLLTFLMAIVYNFVSCLLLNSSTIGQKLLSLRVVNIKNDEKPSKFRLLLRSFLVNLPFMVIYVMIICQMLYLVNFHLYAPVNSFGTWFLVSMTKISNIYTIGIALVFFFFFWFNIYYIANRLILSDILSRTRVVNSYIIDIKNNVEQKDTIYYVDKIFDGIEKLNNILAEKAKQWIEYLKNKFNKK